MKRGEPVIEKRTREEVGGVNETGEHFGRQRIFGVAGPRPYRHHVHQKFTLIHEERERQEYVSGEPTYTEWHEVGREEGDRIIHEYVT